MQRIFKKSVALFSCLIPFLLFAQNKDVSHYVNPFIGTAKSNVYTRWGNEGGTYPGAVAPWGFVQLSPETRAGGYDYKDNSIQYFTCVNHHSGFPGGSGGSIRLMPVLSKEEGTKSQSFSHQNESAKPGYYHVALNNKIDVEITATTHCGWFRITFPSGVTPSLFISDAGDLSLSSQTVLEGSSRHLVMKFNLPVVDTTKMSNGMLLSFSPAKSGSTTLSIQLSTSSVDYDGAIHNMKDEFASKSFDEVGKETKETWNRLLSVVSINDTALNNKTMFYTALYHSLLLPWVVSDVDGRYMGRHRSIQTAKGKHEYGGFSPWDTFRSLHPLLSLLFPQVQSDMMLSMMDVYEQEGYLPTESMTGNHSIPILIDSYLKGIRPIDSSLLYRAMKKSIVDSPFSKSDMGLYVNGFIPYPHTESVTRTVEYAYDDWALAEYAKQIVHDDAMYKKLSRRSRNYRNLFDAEELSLLPRKDSVLYHGTANAGYKEGDQWVYTLFLPQYQRDLINLMGGDDNFVQQIDKEFSDKRLVWDNETMFHVPYLFNSTTHSYKTQETVHAIMQRFSASPGGLPGNDDLGATSSWYVWSALGLYPVCPGNPVYAIGTPLFSDVTVSLPREKQLHMKANGLSPNNFYVENVQWNGDSYAHHYISHADIKKGGELGFMMSNLPDTMQYIEAIPGEEDSVANIRVTEYPLFKKALLPDQNFWVPFTVKNTGAAGTAIVKLTINNTIYQYKHCFLSAGETLTDSISCRLYKWGENKLQINEQKPFVVRVIKTKQNRPTFQIKNVQASPIVKQEDEVRYNYTIKNIGGEKQSFIIPVMLNKRLLQRDNVTLNAGDSLAIHHTTKANNTGLFTLAVMNKSVVGKVYQNATDALVLNIPEEVGNKKEIKDLSGFANNGSKAVFGNYIELPHTASLDSNGTKLTMMEWVYDTGTDKPLTELLAKGDNHVLQLVDGRSLTFFAGGWGRGDCTVVLPDKWSNWHHIAGVCNGKDLRVYIDGELKGITPVEEMINLDVAAHWTIGSNEEFPLDRTFGGKIKGVKIYAAALSADDVRNIYTKERAQ